MLPKATLHAPQACFMHRRCASYAEGVLHSKNKNRTLKSVRFSFLLVTHPGIEPEFPAWEASVLTAWPMGHKFSPRILYHILFQIATPFFQFLANVQKRSYPTRLFRAILPYFNSKRRIFESFKLVFDASDAIFGDFWSLCSVTWKNTPTTFDQKCMNTSIFA